MNHAGGCILPGMITKITIILLALGVLMFAVAFQYPGPGPVKLQFAGDNSFKMPEDYRDWTYLTTGFNMSYNPAMRMGHDMFDNVFVNPEAYRYFKQNGTWPDKTVMILEVRGAQTRGSINKAGSYQGGEVMGYDIHVKDEARFPGKWAFYNSDDGKTAKLIPTTEQCYSCHADHAAVDTTFVQFYPTLLPIAQAKGTLSPAYKKDIAAENADAKK